MPLSKCTFCDKKAHSALAGVRFCLEHHEEHQEIGKAWDGKGEVPTDRMLRMYDSTGEKFRRSPG